MKSGIALTAVLLGLASPPPVIADDAHHKGPAKTAQAPAQVTEGEVRRVDKEAKKITLRHGPIVSLDMPAMSMVFQVKDPAMLDQVKVGDRIRFEAEKIGGQYTVIRIEPAR